MNLSSGANTILQIAKLNQIEMKVLKRRTNCFENRLFDVIGNVRGSFVTWNVRNEKAVMTQEMRIAMK